MTPLSQYHALLDQGEISPDPNQAAAVEMLDRLFHQLTSYLPEAEIPPSFLSKIGLSRHKKPTPPKGLYIYGSVGRGKSMVMDLFYECISHPSKKRIHFHEFMNDVHDRLHAWRKDPANKGKQNPLPDIAAALSKEEKLLCFDEFHVTDITDAMILSKLFTALFDQGVIVVATSNWMPDDLYKDGLQRDLFLPFINLIKKDMFVIELSGPVDYRLTGLKDEEYFFYHSDLDQATAQLEQLFQKTIHHEPCTPYHLHIKGRDLVFNRHCRNALWVNFDEICDRALGSRDYIQLAEHFDLFFVANIPQLTEDTRNQLKRFILFIDALYEHHCDLAGAFPCPLEELYQGKTHKFEFERTLSRLTEMQSTQYRQETD